MSAPLPCTCRSRPGSWPSARGWPPTSGQDGRARPLRIGQCLRPRTWAGYAARSDGAVARIGDHPQPRVAKIAGFAGRTGTRRRAGRSRPSPFRPRRRSGPRAAREDVAFVLGRPARPLHYAVDRDLRGVVNSWLQLAPCEFVVVVPCSATSIVPAVALRRTADSTLGGQALALASRSPSSPFRLTPRGRRPFAAGLWAVASRSQPLMPVVPVTQ